MNPRLRISGLVALTLASAIVLVACDNDPAKGKAAAQVASAVEGQTAPTGAVRFAFSNDGSTLAFVGAKITRKHEGGFASFRGTIDLVGGDPTKSVVKTEIDVGSLTVDEPKLAGHLKTPDFFDVAKFPKATFTSTSIQAGGANGATHGITGNLDLHGVTKSVSFPAAIRVTADGVETDAEFSINRKDFGIVYPGMPDDLIKDEVLIKLKIRAKKA